MQNSLLGWVQSGGRDEESSSKWTCTHCTLLNLPISTTCAVCLNPRLHVPVMEPTTQQTTNLSLNMTKSVPPVKRKGAETDLGIMKPGKKVKTEQLHVSSLSVTSERDNNMEQNDRKTLMINRATKSEKQTSSKSGTSASVCDNKMMHFLKTSNQQPQTNSVKQTNADEVKSKIPSCPTHGKKCSMKEVRKEGANKGRWFFSCTNRVCKYFEVKRFYIVMYSFNIFTRPYLNLKVKFANMYAMDEYL